MANTLRLIKETSHIRRGLQPGPSLWCIRLICLLVGIAIAVEIGTRVFLPKISRLEGRVQREYAGAVAPPNTRPVVLFVGNSLLAAAVQFERIQAAFSDEFEPRRFVVEQTVYYDWRYGLRRLFKDGARPRVVVLMLNAGHLASETSRGEYSAYLLTTSSDIVDLCRDLRLHPTNAASMVVAHFSRFYALRSELRKVVLGRMMPQLPTLTARLTTVRAPYIADDRLRAVVRERALVLRDECSRYGARLVLAIPPALNFPQIVSVKEAVSEVGIETIVPFGPRDFRESEFSDGFHLNPAGAAKFTDQLIQSMRQSAATWLHANEVAH